MEMLDLLGEENSDVKKAIQKILNTETPNNIGIYDTRQGLFVLRKKKKFLKLHTVHKKTMQLIGYIVKRYGRNQTQL
ncbi:hypothetical protein [Enterococcus cecorum]|uniref:hypothetical protein n=1 Tax=Enterococcus cecorum TaxID=44008 RepID=UPI00148C9A21|nr:hypothetical protein [Enterococcus cecorum]